MGVRRCVRATNTLPPSSPTGAACNVYVSEGHNTEALEEMQVRVCKRACVHTCVQARQHIITTTCSAPAQQYKEASCPPINLLTLQVCTPRPKTGQRALRARRAPGAHVCGRALQPHRLHAHRAVRGRGVWLSSVCGFLGCSGAEQVCVRLATGQQLTIPAGDTLCTVPVQKLCLTRCLLSARAAPSPPPQPQHKQTPQPTPRRLAHPTAPCAAGGRHGGPVQARAGAH